METEHHQWSANNLGVDRNNLNRREDQLSDQICDLPLLWHITHPLRNAEAKNLLQNRRVANDVSALLTAIVTGNNRHLHDLLGTSTPAAINIAEEMRAKIEACGVPINQLTLLQAIELFNELHHQILDDAEETLFGEKH